MTKAIFFDIDGTLVSTDTHRIPASTKEAISLLRAKGIKLFIATGRAFHQINNLEGIDFDGFVTMNGSVCMTATHEPIYSRAIPTEDLKALLNYIDTKESIACAFVGNEPNSTHINYIDESARIVFNQLNFHIPTPTPLEEAMRKPVYQIVAFFNEAQEKRIMQILPHCETTRWNPLFTDIIPKGGSKQVGMEAICKHYGIDIQETMAFGDGGNDMQMLQAAGIGIAMGNAEEMVKQHANYCTTHIDKDGIWNALKHFKLL